MRFFDSHAHLDDHAFDEDRESVIAGLSAAGVARVMNIGCSLETSITSLQLARKYPFIWCAVGSHPDAAAEIGPEVLDRYRELAEDPRVRAIGEIGLDYYYDDASPRELQCEAFRMQLELAAELEKPVICHVRDAMGDALELVREYAPRLPWGVFHCFSGSAETALELYRLGWYIGFTGVLTFKNARRAVEAAAAMPPDRIMIETDCPYMAPVPHRGTRNDSRLVPLVAARLAEIRGISEEECADQLWENTCRFYQLDPA